MKTDLKVIVKLNKPLRGKETCHEKGAEEVFIRMFETVARLSSKCVANPKRISRKSSKEKPKSVFPFVHY